MKKSKKIFNDFKAGLNTDFNGLNENPSFLESSNNFLINNDGSIEKRPGIERENILLSLMIEISALDKNKVVSSFIWKKPGNLVNDLFCVQYGESIHFFEYGEDIASVKLTSVISLKDYLKSEKLIFEDFKISFSQTKKRLFCLHKQLEPIYLTYNNGEIEIDSFNILIRDYEGVEVSGEDNERPTELSLNHIYNLHNQGWSIELIHLANKFLTGGVWPSLTDDYRSLYNPTKTFKEAPTYSSFYNQKNGISYGGGTKGKSIPLGSETVSLFNYPTTDEELEVYTNYVENAVGYSDFSVGVVGVDPAILNTLNPYPVSPQYNNWYGPDLVSIEEELADYGSRLPMGKIIKPVFGANANASEVTSIVSRPVISEGDSELNREIFNEFHLIDKINDIFKPPGENKYQIVVDLDKPHSFKGGTSTSISSTMDFTYSKFEDVNLINMADGFRGFNTVPAQHITDFFGNGFKYNNTPIRETNRANIMSMTQGINQTIFDSYIDTNSDFYKRSVVDLDYIITTDISNSATDYVTLGTLCRFPELTFNKKSMYFTDNCEDNIPYLFKNRFSPVDGDEAQHFGFHGVHPSTTTGSTYQFWEWNLARVDSNEAVSLMLTPSNSYDYNCFNISTFDNQEIEKRESITTPIVDTFEVSGLPIIIKPISNKKIIIEVNESDLVNFEVDGLFDSLDGYLLNYDNIFNTAKINLNNSIYLNMRTNYEIIKRDEYASLKIKEEYTDDTDLFSISKIIDIVDKDKFYSYSDSYECPSSYMDHFIVVELDKPHGLQTYAQGHESGLYKINCVSGDYINWERDYSFGLKGTYIPKLHRNYSVSSRGNNWSALTNEPLWGDYFSDWLRTATTYELLKLNNDFLNENFIGIDFSQEYNRKPRNLTSTNQATDGLYYAKLNSFSRIHTRDETNNPHAAYTYDSFVKSQGLKTELYVYTTDLNKETFDNNGFILNDTQAYLSWAEDGLPKTVYEMRLPSFTKQCGLRYDNPTDNFTCFNYQHIDVNAKDMDLSLFKKERKSFQDVLDIEAVGEKHLVIHMPVRFHSVYNTQDEDTTIEDTEFEHWLVQAKDGKRYNLYELLNLKLSMNKSKTEVMTKVRNYRNEWTWDLDGDPDKPAAVSEFDPYAPVFEDVEEEFRPAVGVPFAGRMFYSSIASAKYNNYIFYSELLREDFRGVGKCYSKNDPTDRFRNEGLPTDGGYILIENSGEMLGLVEVGDVLCVVCRNGVWIVLPGSSNYFTSTDFSVKKISNIGCVSQGAISVYENNLVYASENSINFLPINNTIADSVSNDITKNRLDKLYESIPLSSKRNIKIIKDDVKSILYLMYNSKEWDSVIPQYSNTLIYNIITDSFNLITHESQLDGELVKWSVKDGFIDDYLYDEVFRLKLICENQEGLEIFEFKNDEYFDFNNIEYEATARSASHIVGSVSNKITGGYIVPHIENIENTSCLSNVEFGFSSGKSCKTTKEREIYKEKDNYEIVNKKIALRGTGNNLNVNFRSPPGHPCKILGYEITYKVTENK